MITRSKLAEQLREYQKRSQHNYSALTVFSPKLHFTTWGDVAVASAWAFLFFVILVFSYVALYFRYFRLSFIIVCLGVYIPVRLRNSRKKLARKRDLPLSM